METLTTLPPAARPPLRRGCPLLWFVRLPASRDRITAHALLRDILADYLAYVPAEVPLSFPPGRPPRIDATFQGLPLSASLSYADEMALIGLSVGAFIGIDLLRIVPLPDWQAVSALYFGPLSTARLAALPADARDIAFARHWTELEARGKCLGLPLQEFSPDREHSLNPEGVSVRCVSLGVQGLVGTVALV